MLISIDTSIPTYGCGPFVGNSEMISFLILSSVTGEGFLRRRNFDPSDTPIVDDYNGKEDDDDDEIMIN